MTVNFFVTIQHLIGQLSIGRISIKNQAIGYQIGCSATQTNFVAIECSPSVLDNDANVGFKDRNNFCASMNRFTINHPSGGLVYDFISQPNNLFQFFSYTLHGL